MGREMGFRMERAGLIQVGDRAELREDTLSTMAGTLYYYTIREAVAMSDNTKRRLEKLEGIVRAVEAGDGYWTVTVEVDEEQE